LVTFMPSFFAALDRRLGVSRGEGVPSRQDFLDYELTGLREAFSDHWDDLPMPIAGRGDYRTLVATGSVVRGYSAMAQLARDGTVQVVDLDIDVAWPDDDGPED
jgi:hypothetical protein